MGLQWREGLSVGNDLIDSDHKHLIGIINLADQSLQTKDQPGLAAALDQLVGYSKTHFFREEKIAAAVDFPSTSELHQSHELLLKGLDQQKQELGTDWTDEAGERFGVFLRGWLINHVIKEDLLMKPFLKKHSPQFDPT